MTKHTITLEGAYSVTKGPRDKSWPAACATIDLGALSGDIVTRLALHGLHQKIADAASTAKTADEAIGAMEKAMDAILAGDWTSRVAGSGVDEFTRVMRIVVRSVAKAKFTAADAAKFKAMTDEEQMEKLDAIFAANDAALRPAVEGEMERRRIAAMEKAALGKGLSITF